MARRFRAAIPIRHDDPNVARPLRNLDERVREVVSIPVLSGEKILGVSLANSVETLVPHTLGRVAAVFCSPVIGASSSGRIEEVRDGSADAKRYVTLKATGFGATITTDVWVL